MASKYEGNLKFYLEILESQTGLKLRVSNDGDRHFIASTDLSKTYGHGLSISNLYSAVFMATEIISAAKKEGILKEVKMEAV